MMTDVNTTQNQKQTETPTNFAKRKPNENRAHQLPKTDPEAIETNNWPKQDWNPAEWGAWAYYIPFAMGYGGTIQRRKKRGSKRGNK